MFAPIMVVILEFHALCLCGTSSAIGTFGKWQNGWPAACIKPNGECAGLVDSANNRAVSIRSVSDEEVYHKRWHNFKMPPRPFAKNKCPSTHSCRDRSRISFGGSREPPGVGSLVKSRRVARNCRISNLPPPSLLHEMLRHPHLPNGPAVAFIRPY